MTNDKKYNKILVIIGIVTIFVMVGLAVLPLILDTDDNPKYLGNSYTLKFHYPDCQWAEKISESNLIEFKSRQEAVNNGYDPCKVCKP